MVFGGVATRLRYENLSPNHSLIDKMVWLQVENEYFHTTEQTLRVAGLFRNMDLTLHTTQATALVLKDEKADVWRHVLCLLRDPTHDYPLEYLSALGKYHIPLAKQTPVYSLEGNVSAEQIFAIGPKLDDTIRNVAGRDLNLWQYQPCVPIVCYTETYHATVPADIRLDTQGHVLREVYLVLPATVNLEDVWHLKVEFRFGDDSRFSQCVYDAVMHGKCHTVAGYHMLQISTPYAKGLYNHAISTQISVTTTAIGNEKFHDLPLQLKVVRAQTDNATQSLHVDNLTEYYATEHEVVAVTGNPIRISGFRVTRMAWCLDAEPDFLLHNQIANSTYCLKPVDYRIIERHKMQLQPLPENHGAVYFGMFLDRPSGHVDMARTDYLVDFGNARGYLLIVSENVLRTIGGMSSVACAH